MKTILDEGNETCINSISPIARVIENMSIPEYVLFMIEINKLCPSNQEGGNYAFQLNHNFSFDI